MSDALGLIAGWARSAVAPHGGAFRRLQPHEIAAPVLQSLLADAGLAPAAVDAVVLGNALGAGGNPARMLALAAGLPERCAAFSVDTQCCAGLDAFSLAVGLLASGQASVVIAGGVEAWSRSPIRQQRPLHAGEPAVAYERPAFAPDPARDPDLLVAAARHAREHGISRARQDAYAVLSHQRAVASQGELAREIVAVQGLAHDAYPRALDAARAARMPLAVKLAPDHGSPSEAAAGCALSTLAVSAKADGAALLLLATPRACRDLGLRPRAAWRVSAALGCDPATPLVAAELAARAAVARLARASIDRLRVIELHDAFAVQGLSFCQGLGLDPLDPRRVNRRGGGLARGHPIGASGAVALVRVLADLERDEARGAQGLAAVAGAGGIGAAAIVERL